MAFSSVPKESKNQINKAGQILVQDNLSTKELQWARDLAERWRACHAYPINTFQANLRGKLKRYAHDPIAAQRLKRMPTIIDKLKRYPAMKLTTMQDIGGVRAILSSVQDVYSLGDEFRKSRRLAHELIDEHDYIQNPRSEDGYRSLHLIYRYKNKQVPNYDGLRLELQIRTKLQHTWATAVETMGTFLGQALKSRQGDQEWLDFFAIVSSSFAHKENCVPVPRFNHLSPAETLQKVATAEAGLQALDKMRGFSVAVDSIVKSKSAGKGWFYHLIILNSLKKTVQIKPYDRDSFKQAVTAYGRIEAQAALGEKIEPVLVSAGPIDKLRRAYPNFFLDINDFSANVNQLITDAEKRKH
jgi:ppGpp synthetase/RelA/SpoT-type nucleotidyltranferase